MQGKNHSRRNLSRRRSILSRCTVEQLETRTLFTALTIAQENALPGTPESTWDISGAGATSLQGFATDMSVNRGNTVSFKIDDTTLASYHIDIYRIGYYQGNGARFIANIPTSATIEKDQPNPLTDSSTGLIDCGNWSVSASWAIPADATSGVYIARLQYDNSSGASQIPFIVRADGSHSDIIYQTSDTTWQAYNNYGGNSLYEGNGSVGRAYKVSYNRPFNTRGNSDEDSFFNAEYPMIRFMERNGYDVTYMSGIDTDRLGASYIENHKIFMTCGHDEYWSGGQRANVEAARDAGTNLALFTGNQMFWKTRWENSIATNGDSYRTLVCYKETHANAKIDPTPIWTGSWRDPRFSPPADGGRPENAVSGQIFLVNSGTIAMKVPAADGLARLWRNTSVNTQSPGATATLAPDTIGYEWDTDQDNGFRPAGLVDLSTTNATNVEILLDYGSTFGTGNATHHLTLYKAPSGALVFGAGTVQWSWGLDPDHDRANGANADSRMQQAQVNLFADMGVQPATLMASLVPATKSTDTTGPTVTISSPAPNGNYNLGQAVNLSGTASDSGGGVVMGVEVSIDGGLTWHPATGRTSWTYSFATLTAGAQTILVRAIDDSANQGNPAQLPINVIGPTGDTIFGATVPTSPLDSDASAVELGVKFKSDVNGTINGIRFYKGGSTNGGTHLAHLWTSTGTLLATATFSGESASGWQAVSFSNPVNITANTVYVASYYAPQGHYAEDDFFFQGKGAGTGHVQALAAGVSGANGVYGLGSVFPTQNWNSSNYYVDLFFSSNAVDVTPPTVSNLSPANAAVNISTTTAVSATFSEAINQSTLTFTLKDSLNNPVAGTVSYNSTTHVATFTPTAALANNTTYTASIRAADTAGNLMTSATTWSFTTVAGDVTPPSVTTKNPASGATNVPIATTVTATFNENINSTTLVFTLKDSSNNSVAGTVTYNATNFTATLTPNAALAAGATYTASIRAADTSGNLMPSATTWTFTTAVPDTTPPTVSSFSPANGATGVSALTTVTATFSEPVKNDSTLVFTLTNNATSAVVGATVSYNSATNTATLVPTTALAASTSYTASVTAQDLAGNSMTAPTTWSFTTAATLPAENIFGSAVPSSPLDSDASASELGVKFKTTVSGTITGIRFYKGGSTNSGTHVAHLWTDTGTLLASATFSGETTSGWQSVSFATPIAITENTVYVASYYAPKGHYAEDDFFFQSAGAGTGHIQALAAGVSGPNGVWGSGDTFPTNNWNSSNYYVDATFVPNGTVVDTTPPTVSGLTPANNATNVSISTTVSATFSEIINQSTLLFTLKDSSNNPVAGAVSYNAITHVATFTPNSALNPGATYTASISASDTSGNAMPAPTTWSFTTAAPDSTPPTVTTTTPTNGATNVSTSTTITATFSEDVNPATILFTMSPGVTGTTTYNTTTHVATFTPSAALANATLYNVTVTASDVSGNPMTSPAAWSFTTAAPVTSLSMWSDSTVPTTPDSADGAAVNLGVKFRSDVSGYITGIRFYKSALNTGTHIGTIWTKSGSALATATFSGETASGWQTVQFSTPVAITAGTIYVASYYAPKGHYAEDNTFATAGADNATLHFLKTGVSGGNGVYRYAARSRFPNSSGAGANYWVDVIFSTNATGSAAPQTIVVQQEIPTLQLNSPSLLTSNDDPLS